MNLNPPIEIAKAVASVIIFFILLMLAFPFIDAVEKGQFGRSVLIALLFGYFLAAEIMIVLGR